ncbi:MAG TPA: HAMP domain-containing sensor histidine kinase [Thermodesulfobacteriota bacterium]|nr:HAMP domain-containing sensor histidine kinase [Thermodesulfobacteriota bacterium]
MSEKEQASAAILRARAELEQALRELEKMPAFDPGVIAFSAHALNNFLSVTAGTIELLLESLADYPDPQIRSWLEGLDHMTDLMRHTVSQLMTSSAPRNAKLRFLKWDLAPLVRRACNYYQRIADGKNILIVYELAGDAAPVWTDPVAVAAVLDNLLSNAVKYSFPGKRIQVQLRGEMTSVVCRVCDEGPGLSQEDQMKLFQPGIQLKSVATGGEPSSGYGLAVAKELADRLGGDLWCESTLGAGACFSFRLPAYRGQE